MSSDIVKAVKEFEKLAEMLDESAQETQTNRIDSEFLENALLRLFYVKSLELKLEKYQEQLSEDTDMDTFEAVYAADAAIQRVSDKAFEQIESYAADDRKFEVIIENTAVNLKSKDKSDLLNQLYKCEGIIRMAQKTASRFTLYGNSSNGWEHLEGIDTQEEFTEEDKIYQDLGVDIYELFDVRKKLVGLLEKKIGGQDGQ